MSHKKEARLIWIKEKFLSCAFKFRLEMTIFKCVMVTKISYYGSAKMSL